MIVESKTPPALAQLLAQLFFFQRTRYRFGLRTRDVCSTSRLHLRSPTELLQNRIWLFLNGVSDNFAKRRRKLESVPTITGSNYQALALWVACDPKMAIVCVAIHADTRVDDWCICQHRKCGC